MLITLLGIAGQTAVNQLIKCELTVVGYDRNGNGIANQKFDFTPDSVLVSQMGYAQLNNGFRGSERVEFFVISFISANTAFLLDDIAYEVFF